MDSFKPLFLALRIRVLLSSLLGVMIFGNSGLLKTTEIDLFGKHASIPIPFAMLSNALRLTEKFKESEVLGMLSYNTSIELVAFDVASGALPAPKFQR